MQPDDPTLTMEHPDLREPGVGPHTALVIAWSREEPHRLGERWLLPPRGKVLLGRGMPRPSDPATRIFPVRVRPGDAQPTGPLRSQRISRHQLLLEVTGERLSVQNLGRCALRHNGRPVDAATVSAGDVLELDQQFVLLCVRGSALPPGIARHPFGAPDEHGIVGESPAAWELRRQLQFIGPRQAHALLLGESGVGKELAARALHTLSVSRDGPFVRRNAATLPEGLIDAELFGNIANYPNPGMPTRPGLIGAADGGSLFLDELAELPHESQSHLLRVLDSGEYQQLGATRCRTARFRLIGATNKPPEALKHDILARFELILRLPSLNDRREDIPFLLRHILQQRLAEDPSLAERFASPSGVRLSPELLVVLLRHHYTTHIREVSAVLWQSMLESTDGILRPPSTFSVETTVSWEESIGRPPQEIPPEAIQAALDAHNGRIEETWRALKLSNRYALRRLIKQHNLTIRRTG